MENGKFCFSTLFFITASFLLLSSIYIAPEYCARSCTRIQLWSTLLVTHYGAVRRYRYRSVNIKKRGRQFRSSLWNLLIYFMITFQMQLNILYLKRNTFVSFRVSNLLFPIIIQFKIQPVKGITIKLGESWLNPMYSSIRKNILTVYEGDYCTAAMLAHLIDCCAWK